MSDVITRETMQAALDTLSQPSPRRRWVVPQWVIDKMKAYGMNTDEYVAAVRLEE